MRRDGSVEAWASLLDLCPSNRCCPTRQLATARLPRPEIPGVRVILGPLLPDEMGLRSVEWLMKDSTAPKRSSPQNPVIFDAAKCIRPWKETLISTSSIPARGFEMKNELFPRMEEVRAEARYDDPTFRAGATISFQCKRIEEGFLLSTL